MSSESLTFQGEGDEHRQPFYDGSTEPPTFQGEGYRLQIDDHHAALFFFFLALGSRGPRHVRRQRDLHLGLLVPSALLFFSAPDLFDDEGREHLNPPPTRPCAQRPVLWNQGGHRFADTDRPETTLNAI